MRISVTSSVRKRDMSDFAIPEDQQIKQAYHEMVAQSRVTKQRNLHLEKKHAENQ